MSEISEAYAKAAKDGLVDGNVVRVQKLFRRWGINSFDDLKLWGQEDLLFIRGCGPTTLQRIMKFAAHYGITIPPGEFRFR